MDRRRVQALFESHHAGVYGFLLRSCADPSAAEDLAQEVFVRALRDGGREPSEAGERAWLFRIARNLVIDRWRRHGRRPLVADRDPSRAPSVATDPTLRRGLQHALSTLPTPERDAFLMREVGGLSYVEIAAATESSTAAVRSRIYRARCELRRHLRDEPAEPTPPAPNPGAPNPGASNQGDRDGQ